jgi:hypothetical protein
MVRRTARKGGNAGRDFWGCSRFAIDECRGRIDIATSAVEQAGGPGAFAQARFDRHRRDYRRRARIMLPMMVSLLLLLSVGTFLAAAPYFGYWAGLPAILMCVLSMFLIMRLPPEALFWDKGARGERMTAEAIEPLLSRGFVILYGRLMPDGRGDIDSIAVGPTGVFVIETKNLSGAVEVVNGKLFVKDHDRQPMVAQVYREAFAVQQIVGDLLAAANIMVVPILCIHGARTPMFDKTVGGVRISSGGRLASLVTKGPQKLDAELVQKIADLADRKLRSPWSWEEDS